MQIMFPLNEPLSDDPQYKDIPGWDLDQETDQSEQSIRMDVQEIHSHPLFNSRT